MLARKTGVLNQQNNYQYIKLASLKFYQKKE